MYSYSMPQVLTISCKLKVSASQAAKLAATLDAFVQALNWVNENTPEKIVNAVKLQSLCYRQIRTRFGLSSNLAQQVCRRLAGSRKVARQQNRPVKAFKAGFVTYHARIFSFREKDWTVSLTTVEGRERFELAMGNYQRGMLVGTHPKSATLVKRKDGSYSIQICVEHKVPEPQDTTKAIGVDLGRRDIAHTSEGDNWHGQQLNPVRDHSCWLRAVLQQKASQGTRSTRRRCRELRQRLSGQERRLQSWVNHCISKAIVSRAQATHSFIALEELPPGPPIPPYTGGVGGSGSVSTNSGAARQSVDGPIVERSTSCGYLCSTRRCGPGWRLWWCHLPTARRPATSVFGLGNGKGSVFVV